MKDDSGGRGFIQDAVNNGGRNISVHDNGYERGSDQDGGRSAKKIGYNCWRVELNGVISRRHHSGEGFNRMGCVCVTLSSHMQWRRWRKKNQKRQQKIQQRWKRMRSI